MIKDTYKYVCTLLIFSQSKNAFLFFSFLFIYSTFIHLFFMLLFLFLFSFLLSFLFLFSLLFLLLFMVSFKRNQTVIFPGYLGTHTFIIRNPRVVMALFIRLLSSPKVGGCTYISTYTRTYVRTHKHLPHLSLSSSLSFIIIT